MFNQILKVSENQFKFFFPLLKINRKIFEHELKKFANQLQTRKKILDFASAGNKYSEYFKDHEYLGADIENEKTFLTRDNRKIKYIKDHNFVVQDLTDNNLKKNYFDIVVSTHSLEHLASEKDFLIAIESLYQNLNSGGIFFTNIYKNSKYFTIFENYIKKNFQIKKKIKYNGSICKLNIFLLELLINSKKQIIVKIPLRIFVSITNFLLYSIVITLGDIFTKNINYQEIYILKKLVK